MFNSCKVTYFLMCQVLYVLYDNVDEDKSIEMVQHSPCVNT